MKLSKLYAPHLIQKWEANKLSTADYLEKAGFINYNRSGFYTLLPLGTKISNKLQGIIRNLSERENFQELKLPKLQPTSYLKESDRFKLYEREIVRLEESFGNFCLCPTNEEAINHLTKGKLFYRHLPLKFYQFGEVFKNNTSSGKLISSKEFDVFESYSFDENRESQNASIESFKRMMSRLKEIIEVPFNFIEKEEKDYGNYLIKSKSGQHTFLTCENNHSFVFKDNLKNCNICNETLEPTKGLGVAMYKTFDESYARNSENKVRNSSNEYIYPLLGTYGIGISRLIYAIADTHKDELGVNWPKILEPYEFLITPIHSRNSEEMKATTKVYEELMLNGKKVLLDDRKNTVFNNKRRVAYFLGIPKVIAVNSLNKNKVIFEERTEFGAQKEIDLEEILHSDGNE